MIFYILCACILFPGKIEVAAFPHNGPASSYEEADSEFLNGRPGFLDEDHNWKLEPYIGEYYVPRINGEPIYIPPPVSHSQSYAPVKSEKKKQKESLASVYDDFVKQSLLLDPVSPIDNEYLKEFMESSDKDKFNAESYVYTSNDNKAGYDEPLDQGSAMGSLSKESKEVNDKAYDDYGSYPELKISNGKTGGKENLYDSVGDGVNASIPVHIDDSTLEIDFSTTKEVSDSDLIDEIDNSKQNVKIEEKANKHAAKAEEKADEHAAKVEQEADKHAAHEKEKADEHAAHEKEKADEHAAHEKEKADEHAANEKEKADKHAAKMEEEVVKHKNKVEEKAEKQKIKVVKTENHKVRVEVKAEKHIVKVNTKDEHEPKVEEKAGNHDAKEKGKADKHNAKLEDKVEKQNSKLAEKNVQAKDKQKGRSFDYENVHYGKLKSYANEQDAVKKLLSNNFDYQNDVNYHSSDMSNGKEANTESDRITLHHIDTNLNHDMDLNTEEAHSLVGSLDSSLRSLVFNPKVQTLKSFQGCLTRSNETGICTSIQHCSVPNAANTLEQLMNNACVIEGAFIGVCCPEFPVESVKVEWGEDFNHVDNQELSRSDSISCGLRSDSDFESWPWLTPLMSMATGQIFCGGALISDHYVLTAAHCTTKIPKNQILVRLGQRDIGDTEDSSGEDFAIVEIKRHANYNRRNLQNDIALLKLDRRVPLGNFQRTVCLPDKASHVGDVATLIGWRGISGDSIKGRLIDESLTVLSNEECEDVQGFEVPPSLLCTIARNEETRTCNADSGVPLVMAHHDKYEVLAVLSWDRNDCDSRYPSVFTRVSHYKNWIKKHIHD